MKAKTKYRIGAVLVCLLIYFLYIVLAMEMGWKHGGGFLVVAILFGIISWFWNKATELGEKEDKKRLVQEESLSQENNEEKYSEQEERIVGLQDAVVADNEIIESLHEDTNIINETPETLDYESSPEIPNNEDIGNEEVPPIPQIASTPIPLELNNILKGIFVLWMVVAGINSLMQFSTCDYSIAMLNLIFSALGITGIAGMYNKKRWGLIVTACFFMIQFIICIIFGQTDPSFEDETIKVFIKIFLLSILLIISKDGHTAWETIWNNGILLHTQDEKTESTEPQEIIETKVGEQETKEQKVEQEMSPFDTFCSWIKSKHETSTHEKSKEEIKQESPKQKSASNDTTTNNEEDRLLRIKSLWEKGLISDNDYNTKKEEILNSI